MKRRYKSSAKRRAYSKARRDKLRAASYCIDGPAQGLTSKRLGRFHGLPVKGGRCHDCWVAKLDGDDARYWQAKLRAA